ncbi:MAG: hypothetical protein QW112_00185 [Candidatus Micrarchaeia archaeon]
MTHRFGPEARVVLTIKQQINNAAKTSDLRLMLSKKIMIEDTLISMQRKKSISGRACGILYKYLRKKIPKEKYMDDCGS